MISCGAVVLCAGCWSARWLEKADAWANDPSEGRYEDREERGDRDAGALAQLPIVPERGQILSVENLPQPLTRILWAGDTYLVPKADGRVVIGATQEEVGFDCRVTPQALESLMRSARDSPGALGSAS